MLLRCLVIFFVDLKFSKEAFGIFQSSRNLYDYTKIKKLAVRYSKLVKICSEFFFYWICCFLKTKIFNVCLFFIDSSVFVLQWKKVAVHCLNVVKLSRKMIVDRLCNVKCSLYFWFFKYVEMKSVCSQMKKKLAVRYMRFDVLSLEIWVFFHFY